MQTRLLSILLRALVVVTMTFPLATTPLLKAQDVKISDLKTVAERSGFQATSTSVEVVDFVDRVAKNADHVNRITFGKSLDGKPMIAAIVANPSVTTPEDLKDDDRLVLLLMGNIHSGECCGKEALLMLLRELGSDEKHPWLDDAVILIAPNYNTDGNDKMKLTNRRGQDGPALGMGERENSMGLDLNRDFAKLESPEAQNLIALMDDWNPHLFIDCHTTNGSWHRYHLTYETTHHPGANADIQSYMRKNAFPKITKDLRNKGVDTFYYGNFNGNNTTWSSFGYEPRYSTEYVGFRNRIGILSEAYAYIPFKERIMATKAFVIECSQYMIDHKEEVQTLLDKAAKDTVAAGRNPREDDLVAIRARLEATKGEYTIKGYKPGTIPGRRNRNDSAENRKQGVPQDFAVTFFNDYIPTLSARRPHAYYVPASHEAAITKLKQHGIRLHQLEEDTEMVVEISKITKFEKARASFQKHRQITADVERRLETKTVPAGTYVVPMGQPLGNLVLQLLEPGGADSLVAWNMYDDILDVGKDYPIFRVLSPTKISATK
ncbi:MAG: M14 family metallopeptidase [Pirellulaceae bacterium]|nr:M14 family metallopeptidase [Pirellulaceae bacterium]